ncbi:MAG: hypothetical protein IKN63_01335 [Bacilli bacterium]|nr:hypothetical protein [Bacilli bacterium]
MTYGNKIIGILLLSFILLVGCEANFKNFHYDLYDNYSIKGIDNTIKLYKNNEVIKIKEIDYKIKEFKYNSDVVCLKLSNNEYYMIYYYNGEVYGPFTKESLDDTINNDSTMTIASDFVNILKADVIYDE